MHHIKCSACLALWRYDMRLELGSDFSLFRLLLYDLRHETSRIRNLASDMSSYFIDLFLYCSVSRLHSTFINPYWSNVELRSTTLLLTPGSMSSSNRHVIWYVLCWFFFSFSHVKADFKIRKLKILWNVNLYQTVRIRHKLNCKRTKRQK